MQIVSLDGLRFSGLVWVFSLLPSKQTSDVLGRSPERFSRNQHVMQGGQQ
jgi:hypothetical protein